MTLRSDWSDVRHLQRVAWNRIHATRCRPLVAQIVFVWSETDQTRHAL